jgi:SAM-dependent methyltransferase
MDRKQISDTWERRSPYEQYIGRWSRQVVPAFLAWLQIPAGRRWLDVGCCTGALCAAIVDHCSPSAVVGVEPSEGFLETAKENLAKRAVLCPGSATAIPLDDASVDVVASGLVLHFVPNQRAALAEMARVTAAGGTIGAYVWHYAGKMELIRCFWDAAVELDPDAAKVDEAARARLRDRIRARIPVQADGSISLTARAWVARATVANQMTQTRAAADARQAARRST